MEPFLFRLAQRIIAQHRSELDRIAVVLPGKRAALHLRKYLADVAGTTIWSPDLLDPGAFMQRLSGMRQGGSLEMLFMLHEIQTELTGHEEPLEEFLLWGGITLRDLSEVDAHLLDHALVYRDLRAYHEIEEWSFRGTPLSASQQRSIGQWTRTGELHARMNERMRTLGVGTSGAVSRAAVERVRATEQLPWAKVWFVGLNALDPSMTAIVRALQAAGKAEIAWDCDNYYLDDVRQEAGRYLRRSMKEVGPGTIPPVNTIRIAERRILATTAPDRISQVFHAAGWLSSLSPEERAAQGRGSASSAAASLQPVVEWPVLIGFVREARPLAQNDDAPHPAAQNPDDQGAHRRQQQDQPQRVGEEPRQDQKHRRHPKQRPLRQRRQRVIQPLPEPLPQALAPAQRHALQQKDPQHPGQQHPAQRQPQAQLRPKRHEQADLDQRPCQQPKHDPHRRSSPVPCRRMVDFAATPPYIGASRANSNGTTPDQRSSMNGSLIQLLVLAGIAIFLILKLRSVLGTRDGFEKPPIPLDEVRPRLRRDFEVIEGGPDRDITDHVAEGSASARALAEMKKAEPGFAVGPFLEGARGAYEMILMAFEKGELDRIRPFLSDDVEASFAEAIAQREQGGLTVEASFLGIKELALHDASFTPESRFGEIAVRFVADQTYVVRNKAGEIVEGSAREVKKTRDIWTFARQMGSDDPNWQLVATGD